jgi:hypothetical protein
VVGNVAQLQRRVSQGRDLRMILAKTELSDYAPIEMIDLVRRTSKGRDIPILFYGWEPPGIDHGRWKAPTVLIERPASAAAFAALLDSVERKRRLPALSVIDRQSYRAAATELLFALAQVR